MYDFPSKDNFGLNDLLAAVLGTSGLKTEQCSNSIIVDGLPFQNSMAAKNKTSLCLHQTNASHILVYLFYSADEARQVLHCRYGYLFGFLGILGLLLHLHVAGDGGVRFQLDEGLFSQVHLVLLGDL